MLRRGLVSDRRSQEASPPPSAAQGAASEAVGEERPAVGRAALLPEVHGRGRGDESRAGHCALLDAELRWLPVQRSAGHRVGSKAPREAVSASRCGARPPPAGLGDLRGLPSGWCGRELPAAASALRHRRGLLPSHHAELLQLVQARGAAGRDAARVGIPRPGRGWRGGHRGRLLAVVPRVYRLRCVVHRPEQAAGGDQPDGRATRARRARSSRSTRLGCWSSSSR